MSRDRNIAAEIENIKRVLALLPHSTPEELSPLELAGTASVIHSFYNGVENCLKQALFENDTTIPSGQMWHKELLQKSLEHSVISEESFRALLPFLAFRHFFNHSYALDLDPGKLSVLLAVITDVFERIRVELQHS